MKKATALLLALTMVLALCACDGGSAPEPSAETEAAETMTGIGSNSEAAEEEPPAEEEPEEEDSSVVVFDSPLLYEDEIVTVELVQFYEEEVNWYGQDEPALEKNVTFRLRNNSEYDLIISPDMYIGDDSVTCVSHDGNAGPASGKSKTYSYDIQYNLPPNGKPLDSLDDLYDLNGTFEITMFDDNTYIDRYDFDIDLSFLREGGVSPAQAAADAAEAAAADRAEMIEQYADVIAALCGGEWFFNGGSDLTLNRISFTENAAVIAQVYFDGNGKHDNGSNDYSYLVDDSTITVTLSDGSELAIPYSADAEDIVLGEGDYYTLEEIDEGLQGYWKMSSTSLLGTGNKKTILIDSGSVISEEAAESAYDNDGSYFYYGPYEGTYTLNFGGFDTDMDHGSEWFFNIIDGTVTLINYSSVCTPTDGLPGENGYSF